MASQANLRRARSWARPVLIGSGFSGWAYYGHISALFSTVASIDCVGAMVIIRSGSVFFPPSDVAGKQPIFE
ncbi:hypothetical protein AQY21_11335 [Paracoccus sp. MKU1]|nr:hypothetical protein AQY21_11335 [Paracoccus sp. MKU1]